MQTLRTLIVGVLVFVIALPSSVRAQDRHAVDPAALADAVAVHADKQNADRAAIRETLGHPAVREVAAKAGIDAQQLVAGVETMRAADLERVAAAARAVDESLAGGANSVVLSTTTIIIILLVVILLVVAIK